MHQEHPDRSTNAVSRGDVVTLLTACGGIGVVMSAMSSMNIALPEISVATGATQSELTWIADGYTLALASLVLVFGAVGDRVGRRRLLRAGLGLFAVTASLPLLADLPAMLVLSRILTGVAAALVLPATLSLITATLHGERRHAGILLWAVACLLAGVGGIVLSGLLLRWFDWTSTFVVPALIALIVAWCARWATESRSEFPPPFDIAGALLSSGSIAALVLAVLEAPGRGWLDPWVLTGFAAFAVMGSFFVWAEARQVEPLIDVYLLMEPEFGGSALSLATQFLCTFAAFFAIVQALQSVLGWSGLASGLILTTMAITLVPAAVCSRRWVDRWGLRRITLAGMVAIIAAVSVLVSVNSESGTESFVVSLLLLGLGLGLTTTVSTAGIVDSVSDEEQGVASAVNDVVREIGAALGVALAGSVLAASYREAMSEPAVGLPPGAAEAAQASIAGAAGAASELGDPSLLASAQAAYLGGVSDAFTAILFVIVASTLLLAVIMPDRRGNTILDGLHARAAVPRFSSC